MTIGLMKHLFEMVSTKLYIVNFTKAGFIAGWEVYKVIV